jgi:hypothetical protein
MTDDLKTLMDRATERPAAFTPDPASLVATGRRRVRKRRITGSLAGVAAVAVLAAGVTVAVDLREPRSTAPASRPTEASQSTKLCTTSNGSVLGDEAWGWTEVLSISDNYGSASIREAPKEPRNYVRNYAFCITQPKDGPAVPLGGRGGVLLRKTPIDARSSMTTVFGRAYGTGMKVVVQTGDGKSGEAVVKSEFYLYRHVEARPWPGTMPTALTRTVDANGNLSAIGRW